jgi:O-antigen ligase
MILISKLFTNTIFPAIAISMLFVTSLVVSNKIYDGVIRAKEIWFFGIVIIMLLFLGFKMISKKGAIKVRFNLTDILFVSYFVWCFIRSSFIPSTPFYNNHKLQILTGIFVLYYFVKLTIKNEELRLRKSENSIVFFILTSSFITSGLIQAFYGLLQLYDFYPSHNSYFSITGSFTNPAPYALYLSSVFPVALSQIINKNILITRYVERVGSGFGSYLIQLRGFLISNYSFFIYYLSFTTVVSIIFILPATMIRASWVGAIASSIFVLQIKYNYVQNIMQYLKNTLRQIIAKLLILIIITLLGVGLYFLKKDSASGKFFIWEVTLYKIAKKPLFGYGLGRFKAEYNNWQAEYFKKHPKEMDGTKGWLAGNTKYAFNEYIEMTSELGLIGLLFFLLFVLSILQGVRKLLINNNLRIKESSKSFIISFLVPSLISLLICSVISFPFYSLSTLIVFFMMAGALSSYLRQYTIEWVIYPSIRITFGILTILLSVIEIISLKKVSYYITWNKASYTYGTRNYTEAVKQFQQCFPFLSHEGLALMYYGKSLQMIGKNHEAIKVLEEAKLLTSNNLLYISLGDAYKGIKQYGKAESNYKFSSSMLPNRLYPHYLIAKLYAEQGMKEETIEKAEKVLRMKAKTESIAIGEIKEEMEELINKINIYNAKH